jgi:NAD-dependent SIR2 family protein deacetylase
MIFSSADLHAKPKRWLGFRKYHNVVMLTGAGVSVASGIAPFRGPDGIQTTETEKFFHPGILQEDPDAAWKFYSNLRKQSQEANPNAAHRAIAKAQKRRSFLVVTENIDGLHQKAGSRNVIEMHGNIHRTRCSDWDCTLTPFVDRKLYARKAPHCPKCGSVLRPDMVFFGEIISPGILEGITESLHYCDLFVSVGTSGTAYPANAFVDTAKIVAAMTVCINTEPPAEDNAFFKSIVGKAEKMLPRFLDPYDNSLKKSKKGDRLGRWGGEYGR